jgi:hypothetical protein
MNIKDMVGPVQLCIYISILLISVGVAYASIATRLDGVEKATDTLGSNHDLIIQINEKINSIAIDVAELKIDIKDLRKNVERHIQQDR